MKKNLMQEIRSDFQQLAFVIIAFPQVFSSDTRSRSFV